MNALRAYYEKDSILKDEDILPETKDFIECFCDCVKCGEEYIGIEYLEGVLCEVKEFLYPLGEKLMANKDWKCLDKFKALKELVVAGEDYLAHTALFHGVCPKCGELLIDETTDDAEADIRKYCKNCDEFFEEE